MRDSGTGLRDRRVGTYRIQCALDAKQCRGNVIRRIASLARLLPPVLVFLVFFTCPLVYLFYVSSGWFFALIVSFGELNTALFLTGPGETSLPIEIFSYLQFQGSQLVVAATSALQVGLILVLIVAIERLVRLAGLTRSSFVFAVARGILTS